MNHLIVIVLATATAGGGWQPPEGLSEEAGLRDICFVTPKIGWAVGDAGAVLRTQDGGTTWTAVATPVRAQWQSVHFATLQRGWVAGGWRRFDGAGGFGRLLETRDGGQSWISVDTRRCGWINKVWFEKLRSGWLIGEGSVWSPEGLWRTTQGAAEFLPVPALQPGPLLLDAAFASLEKGLAVGQQGRMVRLAGDKAMPQEELSYHGTLRAVDFGPDGAGCMVGADGVIFVSKDGGDHWAVSSPGLPADLAGVFSPLAVQCVSASHFVVVGRPSGYILQTHDAGGGWSIAAVGSRLPLHAIRFRDERNGLAAGESGVICRTDDGGRTWATIRGEDRPAAVMFVVSRQTSHGWPLLAQATGRDGLRCAVVQIGGQDEQAVSCAAARCGATGLLLKELPTPESGDATAAEVLDRWGKYLDQPAEPWLVRQLAATIRAYRPAVLVMDNLVDPRPGRAEATAVAGIARQAMEAAGKEDAYSDLGQIGLSPHRVSRCLVAVDEAEKSDRSVRVAMADFAPRLGDTVGMLTLRAMSYYGLAPDGAAGLPKFAFYEDLADPDADRARMGKGLLSGLELDIGEYRRKWGDPQAQVQQATPNAKLLANLQAANLMPTARVKKWAVLLRHAKKAAEAMPDTILPADVIAALAGPDRSELGEQTIEFLAEYGRDHPSWPDAALRSLAASTCVEQFLRWQAQGVVTQPQHGQAAGRLTAIDARLPYQTDDPSRSFLLAYYHRVLGKDDLARRFYQGFVASRPDGPWADVARAELWLLDGRKGDNGPFDRCVEALMASGPARLDGQFGEPFWQLGRWARLPGTGAAKRKKGDKRPASSFAVAVSQQYLYLAAHLRGGRPATDSLAPEPGLDRAGAPDDTLDPQLEHLWLLLDIDRDGYTYFRFGVDAAGHLVDSLGEDPDWSIRREGGAGDGAPFLACATAASDDGWTLELQVPLAAILPRALAAGDVMGIQVIRDLPADAPAPLDAKHTRRWLTWVGSADSLVGPPSFGLLLFGEPAPAAAPSR